MKSISVDELKKLDAKFKRSHLEDLFESQWKALKLFPLEREYKFHPNRKWRFDFACLNVLIQWGTEQSESRIGIEIEGGTYSGGRHTTGKGFQADCDKYNTAAALGWTVFRFTGQDVTSGRAVNFMKDYLESL